MAYHATGPLAVKLAAHTTFRNLAAGMVLATVAASAAAQAPTDVVGRSLAATCANCHGTEGRAQAAMVPLAGYPADRLVATMQDFRSGKRPATIMHQIAKGYTDAQIDSVARYFATRKPN